MGLFGIILTFSGFTGACLAALVMASQSYLRILFGQGASAIGPALFCFAVALGAWPLAQLWLKKPRQLWVTLSGTQGILGICAASLPYLFKASFTFTLPFFVLIPVAVYGVCFGLHFAFLFAVSREVPEEASQELGKIWGALLLGVAVSAVLLSLVWLPRLGLNTLLTLIALVHLILTLVGHYYISPKSKPFPYLVSLPLRTDQKKILSMATLSGAALVLLLSSLERFVALSVGPSPLSETWLLGIAAICLGAGAFTWKSRKQPLSRLNLYLFTGLLLFLVVYLSVNFWPYWHYLVRTRFLDPKNDFTAYQLTLAGGMFFILALPFFTHGRFLPLFFHFDHDSDETNATRAGQLLGACALGAGFAHACLAFTLPGAFGNDSIFKAALFLLAIAQAFALSLAFRGRELKMALASCLVLLTSVAMSPRISPYHFLQPFEYRVPLAEKGRDAFNRELRKKFEYEYFKDGTYSTIGVANTMLQDQIFARSLFVNGQWVGDTQRDLFSDLMLAHLPHLLAHRQRRTAVFGVGTGQTLNAITTYHAVSQIDVVEPSRELWEQKEFLGVAVEDPTKELSKEPRIRWHQQEAIPYLLQVKEPLDTMVFNATPPVWPGSENLFTAEFYQLAHKKLAEDGIFFQWVPQNFAGKELLAKALHAAFLSFPEVRVFSLHRGGVGIFASKVHVSTGRFALARQRMESPPVRNSLLQLDIVSLETLLADEIMSPADAFAVAKREARPWKLDRPYDRNRWEQARFEGEELNPYVLRRTVAGDSSNRDSLLIDDLKGERMRLEVYRELKRVYCLNEKSVQRNFCMEIYVLGSLLSPHESWDDTYKNVFSEAAMKPFTQLLKVPTKFTRADKKRLDDSLKVLRQFNGPVVQFPRAEVLKWFDSCLATVPKKDTLYGECLFHRIFFEDERGVPKQKLAAQATAYLDWFKGLPLNSENYSTFSAVKNMIVRWTD